jgi:hypothetical protein
LPLLQVCGYQDQIQNLDVMTVVVDNSDALLESLTSRVNSSLLAVAEMNKYRFDTIEEKLETGFKDTEGDSLRRNN